MILFRPLSIFIGLSLIVTGGFAQSRKQRRVAQVAESAKAGNVPGGVALDTALPYQMAYNAVRNHHKRRAYSIKSADRDVGQIVTAMTITGGYTQTGTRVQVTLLKENETKTSLRVTVTQQKRKRLLQTE